MWRRSETKGSKKNKSYLSPKEKKQIINNHGAQRKGNVEKGPARNCRSSTQENRNGSTERKKSKELREEEGLTKKSSKFGAGKGSERGRRFK